MYLQLLLTSLAVTTVIFSFAAPFPLTVTRAAGYPAFAYGLLIGFNGVLIGLFEVSAVAAVRRFRRLCVSALGLLNPVLFLPLLARLGDAAFWPIMLGLLAPAAWLVWRLDATADRPERLRGATRAMAAEQPTLPALAPEA